jgi:hypothetical protein
MMESCCEYLRADPALPVHHRLLLHAGAAVQG